MPKWLSFIIKLAVSVALIAFIATNFDIGEATERLLNLSPLYVVLSALLFVLLMVNNTLRWWLVASALQTPLKFWTTFRLLYIGIFFNQTLPSSVGGDAVRMYLARKEGRESAAYATVLFSRVKLLAHLGKHQEIAKPARQVIVLRQILLGPEHLDLIEPLALLGVIHGTYGRFQAAEALVKRALAILGKHGRTKEPEYAFIYDAIGLIYALQRRLPETHAMFAQGLKIRQAASETEYRDLAQSLNNMGFVFLAFGHLEKAEKFFRKSLKMRWAKLGPNDPDTAESVSNMGSLSLLDNDYDQAERFFKQALAIREKAYGAIHPSIGVNYYNLGLVYFMQGDYPASDAHYRRALAIQQEALGTLHPAVADTLENFAAVMMLSGNLGEAVRFKTRAALIRSRIKG